MNKQHGGKTLVSLMRIETWPAMALVGLLSGSLAFAQNKPGIVTGHVTVGHVQQQNSTPLVSGSTAVSRPATASVAAKGGAITTAPGVKQQRPSVPHLYWHFLMYQNHLDRAAAAHEKQGKDGSWLRNHFQQRLGFTDEQFAPVRTAAQRLAPEITAIKAKAVAIAKEDRIWIKANMGGNRPRLVGGDAAANAEALTNAPVPPGHAQLKQLQQQFEDTIQQEVDSLKSALGPQNAAKLDNLIQNEWSRQVTLIRVPPGKLPSLRLPTPREAKP
ncbi:MAG TPA: hypothetical protein VKY85_21570 [Candidatus Angelobacter sp.]|nr:hypothetical protein [Candidatus Angelobacter sp.]